MDKRKITYDAKEYCDTRDSYSLRNCVEKYTMLSLIGNPQGLRVLDVGCGDGFYARLLADLGVSYVLGVDCTPDFISLAEKKNGGYEGKVEYGRVFVQDFWGSGEYDLVVGSFILNYARSKEELVLYCKAIASHIKPGGRFVAINNNPFEVFEGERYVEYGFRKIMHGCREGEEVVYKVDGMTDPIINYYLNPRTHELAFYESGLVLEWWNVLLRPSERGNKHWKNFFFGPPFVAMIGRKRRIG